MPSWQARLHNHLVRLIVRRRSWGDEEELTRRARWLFGTLPMTRPFAAHGVRCQRTRAGNVRGEWLIPPSPRPGVVLYVHGGGFVSCSAASHRPLAAALARLSARRVFSVDYRLAPEYRFPTPLEDVVSACEWLLASAAPEERLALAGDSAGGNLALSATIRLRDRGGAAPACVVAFSPWTDLAGTGASARFNDGRDVMFRYDNLAAFAKVYLGGASAEDPDASPLHARLSGLPPVLLHVGSTELLLDDARRVHESIRRAGGTSDLKVFDEVAHGWQLLVPLVPEATASLTDAASFIASHLP